jgi:hypothetical protein
MPPLFPIRHPAGCRRPHHPPEFFRPRRPYPKIPPSLSPARHSLWCVRHARQRRGAARAPPIGFQSGALAWRGFLPCSRQNNGSVGTLVSRLVARLSPPLPRSSSPARGFSSSEANCCSTLPSTDPCSRFSRGEWDCLSSRRVRGGTLR